MRRLATVMMALASAGLTACGSARAATPPAYDHVVLAIFENHEQGQIIGAANAPYLTGLSTQGANFTQSYAIEHPSQPNYLDLFSGANQGVTDDSCPHTFSAENIGHQLIAAGRTFAGYSEGLPSPGAPDCVIGSYARKHVPWANFGNLDQAIVNQPYTAFPTDFTKLPTVSWVVPDLCDDMHDCPVATGDAWARDHLDAYAQWAKAHNSLLIVTFDEDDSLAGNRIATLFVGARLVPGSYGERIDHFTVLRTLEDMYGLGAVGGAVNRTAITDVFAAPPAPPPPPPPPPLPPPPPPPGPKSGVVVLDTRRGISTTRSALRANRTRRADIRAALGTSRVPQLQRLRVSVTRPSSSGTLRIWSCSGNTKRHVLHYRRNRRNDKTVTLELGASGLVCLRPSTKINVRLTTGAQ